MMLSEGVHPVPAGHVAAVVTHLEMTAPAAPRPEYGTESLTLDRIETPDPAWYQALFRSVGADWLWFSRLRLAPSDLAQIIQDPAVEVHVLRDDTQEAGLLELDFRTAGQCELAYFGLTSEMVGSGAGRFLMNRALELAWRDGITRFHVHTCTLDHPAALDFYIRSGFQATAREIEIAPDPRLTGDLPREAAPQVPIL